MKVLVTKGQLSEKEIEAYIQRAEKKYPNGQVETMKISVIDNEYVDIEYVLKPVKFQRIRRITGYLVGDLDRFNNAKRSEVGDRLKHNTSLLDEVAI